ncbi:hypothetical protein Rhow_000746 [Rhodococcus wratislaviensis]|uniref:Uncharacterized protein n=1 Tax=Rhodococcus wratislaviensis TaxID=44752 RepID=A0A402C2S4_RHOWR|nr:hypothetical protein Rhow_000746 [Rhodococcus wratislaviensis]
MRAADTMAARVAAFTSRGQAAPAGGAARPDTFPVHSRLDRFGTSTSIAGCRHITGIKPRTLARSATAARACVLECVGHVSQFGIPHALCRT